MPDFAVALVNDFAARTARGKATFKGRVGGAELRASRATASAGGEAACESQAALVSGACVLVRRVAEASPGAKHNAPLCVGGSGDRTGTPTHNGGVMLTDPCSA